MTLVNFNRPVHSTINGMIQNIFEDLQTAHGKSVTTAFSKKPATNIREEAQQYLLELVVPGFNKTDFNLQIDGKLLTISGKKSEEAAKQETKFIRKEFLVQPFTRSFTLDEKIDEQKISANYQDGILTIQLPKKTEAQKSVQQIPIQ